MGFYVKVFIVEERISQIDNIYKVMGKYYQMISEEYLIIFKIYITC
jgi:hypothetical protein